MKICKNCKVSKNLLDFNRKITNKDGYHAICKECMSISEKLRRDKRQKERDYYSQFSVC